LKLPNKIPNQFLKKKLTANKYVIANIKMKVKKSKSHKKVKNINSEINNIVPGKPKKIIFHSKPNVYRFGTR
jgi:hypothetical protein